MSRSKSPRFALLTLNRSTTALLNSCFSANDKEWQALRLQERTCDREIEGKIHVLMRMQKAGGASEPSRRHPVTGKYMKKRQIHASSEPNRGHGEIASKTLNGKEIGE